jgi:plastocyanin
MEAYREGTLRRSARQAVTIVRALRAGRTQAKRARAEVPQVDGLALRDLLAEVAADARSVRVTVNRAQWTRTGMQVAAGDQVTWLAWGLAHVVAPLGISVWPHFALGGRIHGGAVQQSGRDTLTFTADRNGHVELASLFPGEAREDGSIATDRVPYRAMRGSFAAVVVRWAPGTDPRGLLEAVADGDASGLCAAEAGRLADPPAPPLGWHHHPLLRPAETYALSERGIATHVHDAVGIVRQPVEVPLTSTLRLRWSWRLDALPSKLPEDTTLTHDYLSVAVEFDDGQDLTWHWSCALPEGIAYRCPFDHWRRRETHVVVRSGTADLGRWVDEERPVLADHQVAIGGPAPARVIRLWLISCSFLQGNEGRGEFGRIELVDGNETIRVL